MDKEITETKKNYITVLSSFYLRIVAILTMTLDHVGLFFSNFDLFPNLVNVFRIIGRISLPLFIFLLVEGVLHTKNFKKYILRLSIIGFIILLAQIILDFGFNYRIYYGNIFIDLILSAVAIYLLNSNKKWLKPLSIIPFLYGVLSFICYSIEFSKDNTLTIWWLPYFLRTQYSFFSISLAIGFYAFKKLYILMLSKLYPGVEIDDEFIKKSDNSQLYQNLLSITSLILITIIYYVIFLLIGSKYAYENYSIQMYTLISGAFILLYNGKRGYNSKAFRIIEYVYYPMHLLIIFLIFQLLFGGLL